MKPLVNSPSARDIAYFVHPYTNLQKHMTDGPLVIREGKGVWVTDDAGNKYIEGLAGLWCASLGFDEQRLIDAAIAQMRKLPFYHAFAGKSHDPGIDLAERLVGMAPVPMSKVFFANSGSEANDTVVKMVWYYNNALERPKKKKIISRIKAYHGVTVAAASLTGLPANHRDFDLPIANITHTECPHYYRFGKPGESEEQFATRMAEALEAKIVAEGGAETCAAFIAEPIMGAGGVITPPKGYFEKMQAVLKKYDMLMIADEVICGFGRLGRWFGSDHYGIRPDLMSMAKGLSSGYLPIGGVMVGDRVADVLIAQGGEFAHGFTYSGHPVSCAVAIANLGILQRERLVDRVREDTGPYLQRRWRELADHPLVGEVRGVGFIGALELVADKTRRQFFPERGKVGTICRDICVENGLVMRATRDTMLIAPPLVTTREQIDELIDKARRCLDLTARAVGRAV